MRTIKLLLAFSLVAAALLSCKKDQEKEPNANGGKTIFTATTEDLASAAGESIWTAGDQIAIVLDDGKTVNATLVDGSGTATGSFVCTIPSGKKALFAVHPVSALASAEGTTANIGIPDSQAGNTAPEAIAVGKVVAGNSITFKNMNAVLGLKLKGATEVSKIEVVSASGNALAGTLAIDCSGAAPAAVSVTSPAASVSTTTFGAGTYYVTVIPGTHEQGLKIKTYTGEEPYTKSGEYDYEISSLAANNVYVYEIKEEIDSKNRYVSVDGAGSKDGTDAENAMSADQMWSLLSLEDKPLSELDGSVFNLAAGTYDWGADAVLTYEEGAHFSIIGQKGETIFTGNNEHRILQVDGEVDVEIEGISFVGGAANGGEDGGALKISAGNWAIKDCSFSDNEAYRGGAVAVVGSGSTAKVYFDGCTFGGTDSGESNYATFRGGAILAENDTYVNVGNSSFTGNFTKGNGGAFCIRGDSCLDLSRDTFIGNYGYSGGVLYAEDNDSKYPRLFVNGCSFDANYITKYYGCLFNLNGIDSFCMHNSSVRNSYLTANQDGEKACWIDFDGVQNFTSISNCSIIGGDIKSALVWSCNGSWKNYLTNNIIATETDDMASVHSDGAELDKSFNVDGILSSAIGSLTWTEGGYWQWDGKIDGSAPAMITKAAAVERLTAISPQFVEWCGDDFGKDQRDVARGDSWWPGSYQN